MIPRCADAAAAVSAFLERAHYPSREVVAAFEAVGQTDKTWWCVVIAKPHADEWEIYLVWPDGDPESPPSEYDKVERAMIIRSHGNALSHPEALFEALGIATGIIGQ